MSDIQTMLVTGTVANTAMVMSDTVKAGGTTFTPVRNGSPNLTIPHFCAAPRYLPTGINSRPAFDYQFSQGMRASAGQPFNFSSCDIFRVFRVRTFTASEAWDLGSCRESVLATRFPTTMRCLVHVVRGPSGVIYF